MVVACRAAEEEEPDMDGLEGFDRDLLAALSDTLKEVLDGELLLRDGGSGA
jgi:hypothetical protein